MSKQTEALKLARQLISNLRTHSWTTSDEQFVLKAIDEALAEQPAQQQEPVAWMVDVDLANYQGQSEYRTILAWNAKPVHSGTYEINEVLKAVPLYTSPPASKPWVGLTEQEREKLRWQALEEDAGYTQLIKATEAKLMEKNS